MQTDNRLLDDLARMANGALNTLSSLREEIESRVRERVERMLADMDMVPREEFEAVKAMAQTARSEQEDLAARVAELERRLNELAGNAGSGTARSRTARSASAAAGTARKARPAAARRRATKTGPAGAKPAGE
jgi:BMFP domain-containing protein YqiC